MIPMKEEEFVRNMYMRRLTRGICVLVKWGGGTLLLENSGVWRRYDRLVLQHRRRTRQKSHCPWKVSVGQESEEFVLIPGCVHI